MKISNYFTLIAHELARMYKDNISSSLEAHLSKI